MKPKSPRRQAAGHRNGLLGGRPKWRCPTCHGITRSMRTDGHRHCDTCHPKKPRGRPKKSA